MKNRIIILLLSAFAYLPTTNASALGDIYTECGLGHWIANDTGWLASTTNVTWDLGTTASTSYLSSPESCSGPFYAAAKFIHQTYPTLEQETAQGEGEHLVAMMDILGCEQNTRATFSQNIRKDFASAVADKSYSEKAHAEKADSYYRIVAKHASKHCVAS